MPSICCLKTFKLKFISFFDRTIRRTGGGSGEDEILEIGSMTPAEKEYAKLFPYANLKGIKGAKPPIAKFSDDIEVVPPPPLRFDFPPFVFMPFI